MNRKTNGYVGKQGRLLKKLKEIEDFIEICSNEQIHPIFQNCIIQIFKKASEIDKQL